MSNCPEYKCGFDYSYLASKGVLTVFKKGNFLGAIESTTASCDIVREFITELEKLKKENSKLEKITEFCKKEIERCKPDVDIGERFSYGIIETCWNIIKILEEK